MYKKYFYCVHQPFFFKENIKDRLWQCNTVNRGKKSFMALLNFLSLKTSLSLNSEISCGGFSSWANSSPWLPFYLFINSFLPFFLRKKLTFFSFNLWQQIKSLTPHASHAFIFKTLYEDWRQKQSSVHSYILL